MDDEEVSFYSKLNRKKTEKKPILRVQLKKSKQIFYSNSTRDINRNNFFNPERKQYNKNNIANEEIKKISKNDQLKKYDSISYFHKNYNDDKYKNKKKPKDKYIYQRNSNSIEKYFNIKKIKTKYNNTDFNVENNYAKIDNKTTRKLYCMNCINKIKNIDKNISKYQNLNNSSDYTLGDNISLLTLKQLDEDYINNKILQNEKRQLAAFNNLKKFRAKNSLSSKEKLQYIYENSEYPFYRLNLQDYLYYRNKKKNEKRNELILNNSNLYDISRPRKEIIDYYNKVMLQTPILEKDTRPSENYKMRYIETLQRQIDEKNKKKLNQKIFEQKKETEGLNKQNELWFKFNENQNEKKLNIQNIIDENNSNMNNMKKEKDESNKNDIIKGYQKRLSIFKERQKEYKSFINEQRKNEINNLQNWINENLKLKKERRNKKENEDMNWKKYMNNFNKSFNDNTKGDKCDECNLIFTGRLYPLNNS